MVIICHGNNRGQLKDVDKRKAWDIEELIGDLSKVETLVGKPKIMILQCCRGGWDFFLLKINFGIVCCHETQHAVILHLSAFCVTLHHIR